MIKLHQFPRALGLPNPSPFCMKVETYLRMANLPYEVVTRLRPKSPTGKAPYVEVDGEIIADSSLIITRLEAAHGHPVDGRLTLAQRAESLAFQRLMDEHLYWAVVYARWIAAPAGDHAAFLTGLGIPRVLAPFAAWAGKRHYRETLRRQGLGRHPPEVLWQRGISDIQALAHWLGTRPFGFGETPTVFDACLYSYVGNIIRTPWPNPLTAATIKHRSLVDHFQRMLARTFPEYAGGHTAVGAFVAAKPASQAVRHT